MTARIRASQFSLETTTDSELAARVDALRDVVARGQAVDSPATIEAGFPLVLEAARRTLGIEFYEVQIQAGLALTRGCIAEMQTGEGKTFVAAFPSFMHSLTGRGVHVMTVNAYLAERDFELMRPLFEMLGVSVGVIAAGGASGPTENPYDCDITYGPGYEFGFDYLRDQIALMNRPPQRLGDSYLGRSTTPPPVAQKQRGHAFAVIDEIDSVMIDEATTPLLLSGTPAGPAKNPDIYRLARSVADSLKLAVDFVHDPSAKTARLTTRGIAAIAANGRAAARAGLERPWSNYVEQALHARFCLHRDVDYVVRDGEIQLVDQNTGRIFPDRTWRDGLHQAIQVKENVTVTAETRPLARIARQRYFRLYEGLCGLTGTTAGTEREFRKLYRLNIARIPTNRPCRRVTLPTRFFRDAHSKWTAIADDVVRLHATGQPVLIGTRTIEHSRTLAERFTERQIPFELLNGMQTADEADVISRAGRRGAVTIATNMAGRGTDIKLEPGVAELGGLHVIGTERHDSRRVDRQLAGRAARQGDPGCCQFYVSADDEIITRHAPRLSAKLTAMCHRSGEIERNVTGRIDRLQRLAERQAFHRRQAVFSGDDWMDEVLKRL